MSHARSHFVVCMSNEGCDDLEVRKLYSVVPDDEACAQGLIRVIDESGEDYLYPIAFFGEIFLAAELEEALALQV